MAGRPATGMDANHLLENWAAIQKAVTLAETIQGWTNDRELARLYIAATIVPINLHVVEVGAWRGRSTIALALARDQIEAACAVISVDHFKGNQEHQPLNWDLKAEFLANMYRCAVRFELKEGGSVEIGKSWDRAPIGLLFIDGSHEYEDVYADILAWEPNVAPGGRIIMHDYLGEWTGVKRAVDELLSHYKAQRTIECMWEGWKPLSKEGMWR